MKRRLPPLNPLLAFEAAARHLSFTRAADELGVTQGAVSRQVKVLEDYLGITLFDRETTGLRLTPAAERYAQTATRALDSIHRATDHLTVTHNHTTLSVRSYSSLLTRWLVPRLAGFHAKHPEIEVRLLASPDTVDFERDACDVAIAYEPRMNGVIRHHLFSDELSPVCSPAFADEWSLRTPADLTDVPVLVLHARRSDWAQWLNIAGHPNLRLARQIYFDDLSVLIECALQGQGIAIGQTAYLQRELCAGLLIRPFDTTLRRETGYHLVFPKERADLEKVRIFASWLLKQINSRSAKTSCTAASS
jgi:LysR family transcriptional regulator, glycine cleavage system transcriptional activator